MAIDDHRRSDPPYVSSRKQSTATTATVQLSEPKVIKLLTRRLEGGEPVDVLCGVGNRFVAEAKRQLFGRCGIDLLAGPNEILIIADDDADPALVACDLFGHAEHDPKSGCCLVCFSQGFGRLVLEEVARQLEVTPIREIARVSWRDGGIVYVAANQEEAVRLSDHYAP
jgi:sulfopropanediol 3-dehydrogenase